MKKILIGCLMVLFIVCMVVNSGVFATTSTVISGEYATGTIVSTGAVINTSIGWTPREVVVTKITNTMVRAEWNDRMANGRCYKIVSDATGTAAAATKSSYNSTGCISPYAGSASAAKGFTIGTDSDLNTAVSDTLYWRALR